jgi:hypothetical protein
VSRLALFADDTLISELADPSATEIIDLDLSPGAVMLKLEGLNSNGVPVSEHAIRVRVEGDNEPWTAVVSPLDGATVSNPVYFMVNASTDVEEIEIYADDYLLGTTSSEEILSYTFSGTGFQRTIDALAYMGGEVVASDTITITVEDAPDPITSNVNETVVEILEGYPTDGSYEYHWPQSGSWLGNPNDIYYLNELYAEGDPLKRSYCVGLTFEVFMSAMEDINGTGTINGMDRYELDDFRLDWYVRDLYGSGPAEAADNYGIGALVGQWNDIEAGDFLQFWRNSGSGHNVIFIDWEYDSEDNIIGFLYWSTQGSTNGIGYNSEYFGTSGSSVDPNHFYATRVYAPEDWISY